MHEIPENLGYTKTHEWVKEEGDVFVVGITDYAQGQLTDIVYVDLPKKGAKLKKGDVLLTVESVKSAEDVFSPIDGEIVDVNSELESKPEMLNQKPYESWMARIRKQGNAVPLMSPDEYRKFIGE
jgi:glycine cleavage system H protein